MNKVKITAIDHERTRGFCSNPVSSYKFKITFGSRCHGVVSNNSYKHSWLAMEAGERMLKKMGIEEY